MKNYLFSVITPFHNTDLKYFKKSYESVLNQTIGFDRIQYIIVFHNCKKNYISDVKKILKKYSNILFKEVNNDGQSPSSPRNLGIKYATGEYLSFLDSDDYFSNDCLEKVYRHMKKVHADIASVRRSIDLQYPYLPIFSLLLLFNNVEKEIVIHRNNWDHFRMFAGHTCYPVTSCFYKRSLIKNNNISFDESIIYGEDILFNLTCYDKADVISYLTQLIGYNYFMHEGSILQTVDRPREFVLEMAKGAVKIFEKAISMCIDPNDILNNLLFDLARGVIFSSTLTEEDRYQVKSLVEKYVAMQRPMMVNKANDKELAFGAYYLPRLAFLYPETLKNKTYRQLYFNHIDVLLHIVTNNQDTDFGQKYQFKNIRSIEAFQGIVPLTTLADYKPLIELQTEAGESNLFCSTPPSCYIYPDSHNDWKFSLTDFALKEQTRFLSSVLDYNHTMFISEQSRKPKSANDRIPIYPFSQAVLMEYILESDKQFGRLKGKLVVPYSLSLYNHDLSHEDYIYTLALFMLRNKNFNQIITADSALAMETFDFIKKYYTRLINDIKTGDSHLRKVASTYFNELKLYHKANPNRAYELKQLLKKGFNKETIKLIWPKLTKFVTTYDVNQKTKEALYQKYFDAHKIKHHTYFVGDFYGIVGVGSDEPNVFQLAEGSNFYEFLPLNKNAKPLLLNDLKKNNSYRLIVTNHNGLYRYITNLVIKVMVINEKEFKFKIA